ncbi:MAG TPA: hypothetical protein VE843_14515, partial [Ktedonobacteraceae bacterium]|nr:hypothetical protein [Ktedonobacteraceae bacterium]
MIILSRFRYHTFAASLSSLVCIFIFSSTAFASVTAQSLFQISRDPYTNSTSQQQTEVEPDSYSNSSTIVSA